MSLFKVFGDGIAIDRIRTHSEQIELTEYNAVLRFSAPGKPTWRSYRIVSRQNLLSQACVGPTTK
jgi:hypothetical protein